MAAGQRKRFLPRVAGHKQGRRVAFARLCAPRVASVVWRVLTVFAFSSENWNRPVEEVSGLMELLAVALGARSARQLQGRRRVRIQFVGDRSGAVRAR